jgi:DNA invertase Pin-like site-specific DNA recombinase/DNA-binding NarL/FixJ family response regulator
MHLNPPLRPRQNGGPLKVVIVARISTTKQDPRSLDDQEAKCRKYLEDAYDGQIDAKVLATQGSGECLDRLELAELEALIESRAYDVVICEDLSRICRRARAYDFCELCIDHGTRLIAINDRVDTLVEGWQDPAWFATFHHERSNRDTSQRIRRSQINRFLNGGMIQGLVYGYIKPRGAKSDSEISKDPHAETIVPEIFRRLEDGASYAEVADWLNNESVPTGPHSRTQQRWDSELVRRYIHNPILKGVRYRNRKISKRHNKSGRHVAVDASPNELKTRECPHLAFVDPAYYDHVIRLVDERNRRRRSGREDQRSSRLGVSRTRTRFPGQHASCGICGRPLWWMDCGGQPAMVCSGAHNYKCWSSLYIVQRQLTDTLTAALLTEVGHMAGFDAALAEKVRQQLDSAGQSRDRRKQELQRAIQAVEVKQRRLLDCIESGQSVPALMARLQELEAELAEQRYQLLSLDQEPDATIELPDMPTLRSMADAALAKSMDDDPEAVRLLRRLIPEYVVLPYRICDGNAVVARAHLKVNLASLLPAGVQAMLDDQVLTKSLCVDLFDVPQRVTYREEILRLKREGVPHRAIARQLGLKQQAVLNALYLDERMQSLGLTDPYELVTEPPQHTRLRRHLHPRYRFEPLPGFPRLPYFDCLTQVDGF